MAGCTPSLLCLLQAIRAKAESLLGILEQVDSVPAPSSPDRHLHTFPASQRYHPPPLSPPKDLPKAVIISLVVQTHFLCSCPQSYVCDIMHLADTDIICIVLACSVLSLLPSAVERLGFEQYMLTT